MDDTNVGAGLHARLDTRDYILGRKGCERYDHLCDSRTRYADTLWTIDSTDLRHLGGASIVCFWVRRRDEFGAGTVGAAAPPVTGVREALQRRAKASDVQGFINEHSLRVGMTVSLAKRETSLVEVQNAGRRKTSRMSAHYASAELVSQGAVDRHFEDDE